jgi:hypothetical protein
MDTKDAIEEAKKYVTEVYAGLSSDPFDCR